MKRVISFATISSGLCLFLASVLAFCVALWKGGRPALTWLQEGVWNPQTIEEMFGAMPTTTWVTVQRAIDAVFGWPSFLLLLVIGVALLVLYMIAAE